MCTLLPIAHRHCYISPYTQAPSHESPDAPSAHAHSASAGEERLGAVPEDEGMREGQVKGGVSDWV